MTMAGVRHSNGTALSTFARSLTMADIVAFIALAIWLYLIAGRGGFWLRGRARRFGAPPQATALAARGRRRAGARRGRVDRRGIGSLLRQDYPGAFRVILVDDDSSDGTADDRAGGGAVRGAADRLTVVTGAAAAGRLDRQALGAAAGRRAAAARRSRPTISCSPTPTSSMRPDALTPLVARAEPDGLVLTSLMAKLRCESFAERALIPAFVFFFQMLYPFAWVNRPRSRDRGGGGRLHAGAPRRARGGRRHRGDPRRADRRLRARPRAEARRGRSGSA